MIDGEPIIEKLQGLFLSKDSSIEKCHVDLCNHVRMPQFKNVPRIFVGEPGNCDSCNAENRDCSTITKFPCPFWVPMEGFVRDSREIAILCRICNKVFRLEIITQ